MFDIPQANSQYSYNGMLRSKLDKVRQISLLSVVTTVKHWKTFAPTITRHSSLTSKDNSTVKYSKQKSSAGKRFFLHIRTQTYRIY